MFVLKKKITKGEFFGCIEKKIERKMNSSRDSSISDKKNFSKLYL